MFEFDILSGHDQNGDVEEDQFSFRYVFGFL